MLSFSELKLNPKIIQSLEEKGYSTPTPIQAQAIPASLDGKDILGIAQTGTGKTAAFSLPIIHNLSAKNTSVKSGCVRSLILTPTRELASQIADNIEAYGKDLGLRHAVIFGGVSENSQIRALQAGVDILIATPGRLLDLMNQGYVRFMQLEIFVLDEADRMLDMGFINDIKKIIAKIPTTRQTMFFSATMPATIADLAHSILSNPVTIEITPQATTVERIEQKLNFVEKGNKLPLLKRILSQDNIGSVLVFSKTKHGANRIVEFLIKNNIAVAAIHGNKSQGAREKALGSFREGKVKILVATDIAARGIDIPAISHVINFDIPMDPESYVHRIGRTARAGREGVAISFCDPSERKLLAAVEKTINYKIPVDEAHPFHGVAAAPTTRESRSDDREFNESRGRRNFGHKINGEKKGRFEARSNEDRREKNEERGNNRRPSSFRERYKDDSNSSERRPNRSDRPTSRSPNNNNPRRRNDQPSQPDGKSSSLLSFIGLGRKKNDSKYGRRKEGQRNNSNPIDSRDDGKFNFNWFRSKKPDELNLKDSGSKSFGNRERSPSRSSSSSNNRNRKPFGNNRRSTGSAIGNSSNSGQRPRGNSGGNFRKW